MNKSLQLLLGYVLSGLLLFACGESIESQDYSELDSTIKKEMREKLKLAKDGDKDAQMLLSHMYLGRIEKPGYPLNQEKGVYWLEKFATDQHPVILEQVGDMFYNGTHGVEKDLNKAFKWFKKSEEFGYEFAQNNIAWEYATCPLDGFRDGKKALNIALIVVDNDDYNNLAHIDTLAAAYAENDDFENAVKFQRQALGMIDKEESPEQFDDFLKRLKVYKSGKKWREPLKKERLLLEKTPD